MPSRKAFTLIELLVVIAIIAILAVVVVLTLNPAQLLAQSRDANRLSDLATINSAVNLYMTDQSGASGFSLGNASSVYLSLPDTSSGCANLGLPTTSPSGIAYGCSSSTSSRNISSSGWIPINFSLISAGSPLGALPVDPTNQSSSGLYYAYYGNGTQFEATAIFESAKYKVQYGQKPIAPGLPEINAVGNSLNINPLFNSTGLVGYWNLDEGSGSSTLDSSGNNNIGNWNGSTTNGSYYTGGKVGSYAGNFDGSTDSVVVPSITASSLTNQTFSWSIWVRGVENGSPINMPSIGYGSGTWFRLGFTEGGGGIWQFQSYTADGSVRGSASCGPAVNASQWINLVIVAQYGGSMSCYQNGVLSTPTSSYVNNVTSTSPFGIGFGTGGYVPWGDYFSGQIDDVRIYNRALSAAEIQALYNAEH